MFRADPTFERVRGPSGSIEGLLSRARQLPHVRFGFVGVSAVSTPVPLPDGQRFFLAQDPETAAALAALQQVSGNRRSVMNALDQVGSFIAADMAAAPAGEVLRSRYIATLVLAGPPEASESADALSARVARLQEQVLAAGALELRINVVLVYYGPKTVATPPQGYQCWTAGTAADPLCACSPSERGAAPYCGAYCDVQAGLDDAPMDRARQIYAAMTFVGGGELRIAQCPAQIDLNLGVTTASTHLVKKSIVVFNRNMHLDGTGARVDSDGDGLADGDELVGNPSTDPTLADTDGDGLGDLVELASAPRQSPIDPTDKPAACAAADDGTGGAPYDRDQDGLNDCEEGLLQTSPTIADTDGDGLPDGLEVYSGTGPLESRDRQLDLDHDGVANATEVIDHTNPRIHDAGLRGRYGYRGDIVDIGSRLVATMDNPKELPGLKFIAAAPNVVGGPGFLHWDACARTLAWSDARYRSSPRFEPVPLVLERQSGTYRLYSRYTENVSAGGSSATRIIDETYVDVYVTESLMPSCPDSPTVEASPAITVSERSCYDVDVANIKLVPTRAVEHDRPAGHNDVLVYFTQAPLDRLDAPGLCQIALIPVQYRCTNPRDAATCQRDPASGVVELTDSDFVSSSQ